VIARCTSDRLIDFLQARTLLTECGLCFFLRTTHVPKTRSGRVQNVTNLGFLRKSVQRLRILSIGGHVRQISVHRNQKNTWTLAATALWVALVSACSTTGSLPSAPQTVSLSSLRYKIGPLDMLNVVVWRNPELSGPLTVRPDGYISMPLIGDVKAAGKSPEELSLAVRAALVKLVVEPVVSTVVTSFQGVYADQVRVVGETTKPQAVAYRQDMTLLDVMIQAGGMTDFADGNSAVLIRGSEAGKQYRIRLKDLLKRGDISANVAVLPGDIVMVPQSWF
jgi:polysaccharide biosynthesis/export protein